MAYCFGFGSLVNTGTHQYSEVHPERVSGFARTWINNDCYEHAFLSVIHESQSYIQGRLARVYNDDWQALDKRELGYTRQNLTTDAWSLEHLIKPCRPTQMTYRCISMLMAISRKAINPYCGHT